MGKGTIYPPEGMHFIDEQTGVSIRQVTAAASIHHPPFYYIPAYDDAMQRLCFVSHRTGRPEIFVEQKGTGKLLQLTSRPDITEWSLHPSHDGRYIYFTAGSVHRICTFNAWHAMVDRAGRRMVADTVYPDIGLQLFNIKEGISKPNTLCRSLSSNVGDHWNTDHCPYDDGPVDVYAPQHTHPHPNFSPDGTRVVFTSDRTGYAQIYEVIIDQSK